MTMPHSKRPRRARVNKKRKRLGLPELPPLVTDESLEEMAKLPAIGVTTIMIPLPTPIRALLTQVRKAQQLRDPSTVASDQLFAGAVLTAMLPTMLAQLTPEPLIVAPTPDKLVQAQKVGKVLGRPFNG